MKLLPHTQTHTGNRFETGGHSSSGTDDGNTLTPEGYSTNPSRMAKRLPLAFLAGCGALVALYLTLYQTGVIGTVWEPFFGDGSKKILDSSLATSLPVPDALLGVIAYLIEVVLDLAGAEDRWRRRPWLTIAFGAVVIGMAAGSIGLVLMQAFYFRAFCTLCLVSAAISLVIASVALGEPLASLRHLRQCVGYT